MPYKGSKRYHGPSREKIVGETVDGEDFVCDPDHQLIYAKTETDVQTITLPKKENIQDGKVIEIVDVKGNAGSNPVTITQQNTTSINGGQQDKQLSINYSRWILHYHDNSDEWIVQNTQV